MQLLHDLVFDYTLRTVALGAMALGIVSGTLGTFAVLRRQSLLGDAISHAALPGIALAFLITGNKDLLLLGAAMAGLLGTLLVMAVVNSTRVPEDSALGIVLSVFFGFGLVLLTFVQRMPTASQAGLNTFLFGQAATLVERDVVVIAALGAAALLVVALFWKEFKLLSFDREFGASIGFRMRAVDIVLTTALVASIVIGLQTVGVVLMSAMVVAPAAAARQWTDSLGVMVFLAALFGALSGVSGAVISSVTAQLPTGPTIVLVATLFVVVSIAFAPRRGLAWQAVRRWRSARAVRDESVLADLYALAAHHVGEQHGHPAAAVGVTGGAGRRGALRTLQTLETRGLVRRLSDDAWALTSEGRTEAAAALARRGDWMRDLNDDNPAAPIGQDTR